MVSRIDASRPADGVAASKSELRHNLAMAKAEIEELQKLRPGVVFGPSATVGAIIAALQAGRRVYLAAGDDPSTVATYDFSSIGSAITLSRPATLVGAGRDLVHVILGGADQLLAPGLFDLRADLVCTGITFRNGRSPFDIDRLDQPVSIRIEDCGFQDAGSIIFANDVKSFDPRATIVDARINRNRVRRCNSGVHLRVGDGAASDAANIPVHYFEAIDNDLQTIDKYGIVCNYDSPARPWPVAGEAKVVYNRIVDVAGRGTSQVTGFGINVSATQSASIAHNHLREIRLGSRRDLEGVYLKNLRALVANNVFSNVGENQAAIACKGDDDGQITEAYVIMNNLLTAGVDDVFRTAIWIQASNCRIADNKITGGWTRYGIRSISAKLENIHVERNAIEVADSAKVEGAIDVRATGRGLVIRDNVIRMTGGSARKSAIWLRAGTAPEDRMEAPYIAGNRIESEAPGPTQLAGITLAGNQGAIVGAVIARNVISGTGVGIRVMEHAVANGCTLQENLMKDVALPVEDESGSARVVEPQVQPTAGDGAPTQRVIPMKIGEEYFDCENIVWYKSVGLTADDWRPITV